ncbi:MAG TPA: aminopeptidase [Ramlibacter sp.]|nr:aminopeptidase [Ramlibacter sp.]
MARVGVKAALVVVVGVAAAVALGGCANVGYYWQSAAGHLQMMRASRPVDEWVGDAATPQRLKERLALSQRIRRFASSELKLPDNPSYTRYADLHRNAVVWNVVAAPALSLTLRTWCFPVTGCVGYRGYFAEGDAQAEAGDLRQQGYEAAVYPVPAYSTLGWMNWAGGDPLLNTFIQYPEGELARLIFHELAHQVLYVKNDTMFNESFATAVERLGSRQWLAAQGSDTARQEFESYAARRAQFRALLQATRERLGDIYEKKLPQPLDTDAQLALKAQALTEFRAEYARLRDSWAVDPARLRLTDRWVAEANNASFGAQAAYDELVPGLEALFEREGRDWPSFYAAARRLGELTRAERHQILKELARA